MHDKNKTNAELINELTEMRRQIAAYHQGKTGFKEFDENLLQNSAAPTFVLDSNHKVVFWNRACEVMTGIKAADIIGTNDQWKPFYDNERPVLADLVIDANADNMPLLYSSYAKSKFIPEGLQAEGWYPGINGVERYISFNAAPIRNSRGELIAAVETFEDLSEIKLCEKKLKENEKRYRTLFEESPIVMLVIDPDSAEIVGANKAAFFYYGYRREELTGKAMTEIIALPGEQVLQMLREAARRPHEVQLENRLASGETRAVEMSQGPIDIDDKTYLFTVIIDITARKEAEETIQEGESKLLAFTSIATDAIILIDDTGKVCYWNIAAEKMFGYDHAEMMGRNIDIIVPQQYKEAHRKGLSRFVEAGHGPMVGKIYEVSALRKDGSEFPVEVSISGLSLKGRWHSAGVVRDISDRRNLENQLRQAQKMEAMGTFAGGIAHDFNNILTTIIGHGTILTVKMVSDDPLAHNVQQILAAADRATRLTQSLLAFCRKTHIDTRLVNLNDIIIKFETSIIGLLRKDIEFKISLMDEELTIMADRSMIEQVLMNLATNSRDAMTNGGLLRISTAVVELDREFIRVHGYGTPGRYAALAWSDTGAGMDKETVQRIFEPFFTTKEVGKGTGLGLAIIYGIIQQHKGYINCYSEPGKGTTFRIYLPLTQELPTEAVIKLEAAPRGRAEMILLAEDDTAARNLARQMLESYGYTVIEAVDGDDAVAKFNAYADQVNLVVLDVIMPKKNGKAVCDEILKLRPEMKCLFTSGYAADLFDEIDNNTLILLSKPIMPTLLLNKIRELLDKS